MMVLLALFHLLFPARFRWKEDFQGVSLLSRQMFYVHTGFIVLIVLLNGLLFLFLAHELLSPSKLSAALLGGISVFWLARLFVQFFVFSPELWRGRKFETRIHLCAIALWCYFAATSLEALMQALG
jgi:hypothetical protein